MSTGVRRFEDLRAWKACMAYKRAVYKVCEETALARDFRRRDQLEHAVAGPPAHIAEGFGRFNPSEFAHFLGYARSSLMESQTHLLDAVDKRHITEETRQRLNALAVDAIAEVTGLLEYLQSPEALRNARRARERRIASRPGRLAGREPREPRTPNHEQRTSNPEPNAEPEDEPSSQNPEE